MTDTSHVRKSLDVLRAYYADRDGAKYSLNETQIAVYLDGLGGYDAATLEAAARRWMRQSQFFPKLSELLGLISPPVDLKAAAHLAFAAVERAIREGGIYRGAHFLNGAIGEAARQTFGSWQAACSFELDSPGWAIRRQTFLAIFPGLVDRPLGPVTLYGLQRQEPYVVGLVEGVPMPLQLAGADAPWSHEDAAKAIATIRARAIAAKVVPS